MYVVVIVVAVGGMRGVVVGTMAAHRPAAWYESQLDCLTRDKAREENVERERERERERSDEYERRHMTLKSTKRERADGRVISAPDRRRALTPYLYDLRERKVT